MSINTSIIVCCYNSAARIEKTLNHLLAQENIDYLQCEIIVVDNNSTDNTRELSATILKNAKCVWQIATEKKQGLTAAREAGIAAAKGQLILFCDDDNILAPDYVARVVKLFEGDPSLGAVGGCGQGVPVNGELPYWFTQYARSFACYVERPARGYVDALFGAGLALRCKALAQLQAAGFESMLEDRKGSELSSGGDTELCLCLRILGWRVLLDPALRFQHMIPSGRLTTQYLMRLADGFGRSEPIIFIYKRYLETGGGKYLKGMVWLWAIRTLLAVIIKKMMQLCVKSLGHSYNYTVVRARWQYLTGMDCPLQLKLTLRQCRRLAQFNYPSKA